MNQDKPKVLKAGVNNPPRNSQIGGKGTVRRKRKVIHRTATTDDKKLQNTLKKLGVNAIPGIEEVNMIKDDGTVIHFNNPKVQASLQANTFAITGHAESKKITEMVPGILSQLRPENFQHLKSLAPSLGLDGAGSGIGGGSSGAGTGVTGTDGTNNENEDDDDDVPDLVENFDDAAKIQN